MKVILIDQHSETDIDQVIAFVPDDYDTEKVLEEARSFLQGEPFIESEFKLIGYTDGLPEYRFYVG